MWDWTWGEAGEGFRPGRCNLLFGGFRVGTDDGGGPESVGSGAGGAGLVGIEVVAVGQRDKGSERDRNRSTKNPAEQDFTTNPFYPPSFWNLSGSYPSTGPLVAILAWRSCLGGL